MRSSSTGLFDFTFKLWNSAVTTLLRKRAAHIDRNNTDQNQGGSHQRPRAYILAAKPVAYRDRNYRIHVGVGSDLCGRFVMQQPDVGRKCGYRARNNEIYQ